MSIETDKPIELVNWAPVATWNFKTSGTECPICKHHYEELCLTCEDEHTSGEPTCEVSRGKCGHCFHRHCINSWLKNSNICPICTTPYANDINNMANTEEWKKLLRKKSTD